MALTPTELRVAEVVSKFGGQLGVEEIGSDTAMAQDALIDGIDVDDFVSALEAEFGEIVREIPWLAFSDQRASFRGCMSLLGLPLWLVWRFIARPVGERILQPVGTLAHPRLTVGHIAQVIDSGYWFEPTDMAGYARSTTAATALAPPASS